MEAFLADISTPFDDDDDESPSSEKPSRRGGWTPGFHEQVDLGIRTFELDFQFGLVSVAIEYRENGTGSSVWDAAVVLAKYLTTEVKDKDVLELGTGTGFVGLVAAKLGGRVILTDLPECLDLPKRNCPDLKVQALTWGTTDVPPCDVVLCADCLLPGGLHLFEPLRDTLVAALLQRRAIALIAFEERMVESWQFFDLLRDAGLKCSVIPSEHHDPVFSDPRIHIVRCYLET